MVKPAPYDRRHTIRQHLIFKKFATALAAYFFVAVITALAMYLQMIAQPSLGFYWVMVAIITGQVVFAAVFVSYANLAFAEPSLVEAQMWVGILSVCLLLPFFSTVRTILLVLYVPIFLFGVFKLSLSDLIRCALLALFSFSTITLWQVTREQTVPVEQAMIEVLVLTTLLFWLCLLARHTQKLRRRTQRRSHAMQVQHVSLRGMVRELQNLAAIDELTGLYNRRHFLHLAQGHMHELVSGSQHGLALLDLDLFKRVNDTHGHAAGDLVLQAFAGVAVSCLREGDVVARYGGEEFVLLLPNTDAQQLSKCCERVRVRFSHARPLGGKPVSLSVSIGMTLLRQNDDLDSALLRADHALYQAKREGRNRCVAKWDDVDA